jgi:hypothetical protein
MVADDRSLQTPTLIQIVEVFAKAELLAAERPDREDHAACVAIHAARVADILEVPFLSGAITVL